MDFDYSDKVQRLRAQLSDFMRFHVEPANVAWHREVAAGRYPQDLIERLKSKAFSEDLWNLFLPGLRAEDPGQRLSNVEYAPLAEIMGRVHWAPEVFNCNAPDTGNMELLHLAATPAQRSQWLDPLLIGEIRSCFAMSEPDAASSDARNIRTTITRDGDDYVVNGRKWFITGPAHPNCRLAIVMGVTGEHLPATSTERHSMLLVPMNSPGLTIARNIPVMHYHAPEGHCELVFRNVRVPVANLLGEEGKGFRLAQDRLGPGRVHHCMRTIGQCEVALELMAERALEREAFGRHLADFANVQDWIAESRLEIDQARLLVMQAAHRMDRAGNAAARIDVSAIKVVAARLQTRIVDRAMQVFGAMGLTPDTPLSYLWTWGRAMRFLDGPDEVHLRVVARAELAKAKAQAGRNACHFVPPSQLLQE
ncbi:acyl-CoA dehydrogenase [Rhodopseudomonas thermotolerans]|uniref:Acyl-CoA dehydrogenase n=2 Tax=Rhodopseudomonas TaxID=1073 RepID=A0A336JJT1_9BRAD|nr:MULTISPECIES: acyl-CoA dehydrogenase family protein [Rhodopseudomonas]RED38462.1 acyl-CoA dehydrogenase [Rhodopseudomonas pentothenatexigens]REG06047.1 acyl-CoA dehydrogenase [Rhodopseudomonas thermotolerans]SSW89915.1 acyl-CoA dehydrogenase [Rhodopseudomonas pentothenatexigens]